MIQYDYRDSLDEWETFYTYEIQEFEDNLLPITEEKYIRELGNQGYELVSAILIPSKSDLQNTYEEEEEKFKKLSYEQMKEKYISSQRDIVHRKRLYFKKKRYRKRR